MAPIIEVKNIGKKYNIAHMKGGYVALRDVIASAFKNPFGFMRHKAAAAIGIAKREEFWALKNVSFTVEKGEVVGIIGANGAGKSTLLKILSQITPPTEGEIVLRGRVGSLLEVGTGFHPELTGRENIFLNGAILGMKRTEIAKKFDEITRFAGIEKFLDTPVKHYSSGMYVRLAFSVAAHMDPDILIIDEVLAVGDAEFQAKCLGKMDEITRTEGRTIIFVSHNMDALRKLCPRTILLEKGAVVFDGKTDETLAAYTHRPQAPISINRGERTQSRRGSGTVSFKGTIHTMDIHGAKKNAFLTGETVKFTLPYIVKENLEGLYAMIGIYSDHAKGTLLWGREFMIKSSMVKAGEEGSTSISIDLTGINPGEYPLYFWIGDKKATHEATPINVDILDDMTKPLVVKARDGKETLKGVISLKSEII